MSGALSRERAMVSLSTRALRRWKPEIPTATRRTASADQRKIPSGTSSYNPSVQRRLVPFAISFTTTCLFFINVCDWIFDCGCRSLWAGADAMCNVHIANSRHCPICSHGMAGYTVVMAAVSLPQFAASFWLSRGTPTRIVVCLLLFPAGMVAAGVVAGSWDGYW